MCLAIVTELHEKLVKFVAEALLFPCALRDLCMACAETLAVCDYAQDEKARSSA